MTASRKRRHVEHRSHAAAAAPDFAFTAEATAVLIKRSDADKRRDLFTVQPAQLRQIGQHGHGKDRTYALLALDQLVSFLPGGRRANRLVEACLYVLKPALQPVNVRSDVFAHGRRGP